MSTIRGLSKCIILILCSQAASARMTRAPGSSFFISLHPSGRHSYDYLSDVANMLKRTKNDEFAETIQTEEYDQDDGQTAILLDKKNVHFDGVLRSGLPEEILRSMRSSLIPKKTYDGLPLGYLTMINGK